MPASKSHTIRAVAIASMADGLSRLQTPLVSEDTFSAAAAWRAMGANINTGQTEWIIKGTGGTLSAPDDVIDVGNSGTTLRLALASAALVRSGATVFTGDAQVRTRPMGPLLDALTQLGAVAFSTRGNGCTPVVIEGPIRGGQTEIDAVTSQFLSSLLINTPLASRDTDIKVTRLNEKPYVDLTLAWLDSQEIRYEAADDYSSFHVPGGQSYHSFDRAVPADFSSATFFLCAAALCGEAVSLIGLDFDDPQGDKKVVDLLKDMGANIVVTPDEVRIDSVPLHGAELDLNATPDALPALAVTACFAEGKTLLLNVPQARLKETDRIAVMTRELRGLGARIEELDDGMMIEGGGIRGGHAKGHNDHRIVMALTLAGLAGKKDVAIDSAEAVNVTFPDYVKLMNDLGADMAMES